jgi:hypothetical protein
MVAETAGRACSGQSGTAVLSGAATWTSCPATTACTVTVTVAASGPALSATSTSPPKALGLSSPGPVRSRLGRQEMRA